MMDSDRKDNTTSALQALEDRRDEVTESTVQNIITKFLRISSSLGPETEARLLKTHGAAGSLALFLIFRPAYEQLDRMEYHIRFADDEGLERCRKTYLDECNMAAIAGTILAQVALTSLALPSLSQAHWVARAALLLSIVSGCLAVFFASMLQRTLGNMRTPARVKSWWRGSAPYYSIEDQTDDMLEDHHWTFMKDMDEENQRKLVLFIREIDSDDKKILVSSVTAAVLMSAPTLMINFAVGAFLTGIGIYFGFVWKNNLDPLASKAESRNVFVCFIVSLGACNSFYVVPFMYKLWQSSQSRQSSRSRHRRTAEPTTGPIRPSVLYVLHDVLHDLGTEFTSGLLHDHARREDLKDDVRTIIRCVDDKGQDYSLREAAEDAKKSIRWKIKGWKSNPSPGVSGPLQSASGKAQTEIQETPLAVEENLRNTSIMEALRACADANNTLAEKLAQMGEEGFQSWR